MKPIITAPPDPRRRPDDANAFLPDSADVIGDDEAEAVAEEFITEATSAEHVAEDARNEAAPDEIDAPSVTYDPALVEELERAPAPAPRPRRGFASMDRERVRAIARKGGEAAHRLGTAHRFTTEEARRAGRKGGLAPHKRRAGRPAPAS